jgi:hypothetical protein
MHIGIFLLGRVPEDREPAIHGFDNKLLLHAVTMLAPG